MTCPDCERYKISAAHQEQPQQEPIPFAFYDPVYRKIRQNPCVSLTVEPVSAWQGEIPLYLHLPK